MSFFSRKNKEDKLVESNPNEVEQRVTVIFENSEAYIETPEDNPIDYPHLIQAIAALRSLQKHMEDTLREYKEEKLKEPN